MSPTKLNTSLHTERLEAAAEWWLRLREPNVTPDVIAEWMLWCEADTENKSAFASIQSLWHKAKSAPLAPVSRRALQSEGRRRRILPWAIAAGALLATLVSLPWLERRASMRAGNDVAIATAVGTNREISLPDGSQATLGGATALTISCRDAPWANMRARSRPTSPAEPLRIFCTHCWPMSARSGSPASWSYTCW